MNTWTTKVLLSVAIVMIAGTHTNAQSKNNREFANGMRDSTKWQEQRAMPPIPKPNRQQRIDNAVRRFINARFAAAMRDSTNWQSFPVQTPMRPTTISRTTALKNSKVR